MQPLEIVPCLLKRQPTGIIFAHFSRSSFLHAKLEGGLLRLEAIGTRHIVDQLKQSDEFLTQSAAELVIAVNLPRHEHRVSLAR